MSSTAEDNPQRPSDARGGASSGPTPSSDGPQRPPDARGSASSGPTPSSDGPQRPPDARGDASSGPTPSSDGPQRPPDAPGPTQRAPWTRRFAPLLLVAGAVLAGSLIVDRLPKERHVELRLEDAASVRQLDVIWTQPVPREHGGDVTPIHGSSWRFAEGTAPKSVLTTVRLPDGPYDVHIEIDRTSGRATSRRTVTLGDADRLSFPIR